MQTLAQDFRYALRHFAKSRGFTAAAILSLALGVGANTAIFSVASALLLRPLPYADADRLVILWNRSPGLGIAEDWFSTAQYFDIKTATQQFDQVAIAIGANYNLTGDGAPERVGTIRVSSNLLPMLGVDAAHGRLFTPDGGSRRRGAGGDPASRHVDAPLRRRSLGGRTHARPQRRVVSDRRRPAAVVLAAPRGDADARHRRRRRDPAAACRSDRRRRRSAAAKTTTSSRSSSQA